MNLTSHVANTFLVNNLDQGDPHNAAQVHSPYKQEQGKRAAQGIAALTGLVPHTPYLGPSYSTAVASLTDPTTMTVTVTLQAEGLYGKPPVVNSSVACPPSAGHHCEAFAVQASDDQWHTATSVTVGVGADKNVDANALSLTVQGWPKGLQAVATRAMFSNWPLVYVRNALGTPPRTLAAAPCRLPVRFQHRLPGIQSSIQPHGCLPRGCVRVTNTSDITSSCFTPHDTIQDESLHVMRA